MFVLGVLLPKISSVSDSGYGYLCQVLFPDTFPVEVFMSHMRRRERKPLWGKRVRHLDLGAFVYYWFCFLSDTSEDKEPIRSCKGPISSPQRGGCRHGMAGEIHHGNSSHTRGWFGWLTSPGQGKSRKATCRLPFPAWSPPWCSYMNFQVPQALLA